MRFIVQSQMQVPLKVTTYIGTILSSNDFVTYYVSCKNLSSYFHILFTILFTLLTLLYIDWRWKSWSTRLIVYSFSSSLTCSHEYNGHTWDFRKIGYQTVWCRQCLTVRVVWILPHSEGFVLCLYVVIWTCVELTSHVRKAVVTYIFLLNANVPFLTI